MLLVTFDCVCVCASLCLLNMCLLLCPVCPVVSSFSEVSGRCDAIYFGGTGTGGAAAAGPYRPFHNLVDPVEYMEIKPLIWRITKDFDVSVRRFR